MSNIIDSIQLSGTTYQIQGSGGGGNPTVEVTQAEYDALVTAGTVQADTYYIITDAQAGDLTNYYTKSQTNTLLGGKSDTATTYTKTEVDNAITAATATKQDTLVSGTNIKTINNQSILGSGNITIQGGGGTGSCTVNDTIIYDTYANSYNGKTAYVIMDYGGDKTQQTSIQYYYIIQDDNYNYYVNQWITFDYVNQSYTFSNQSEAQYIDITYDSTIEDFIVSVASSIQSVAYISTVNSPSGTSIKVPFYDIESGSPCDVIENDVPEIVAKTRGDILNSVKTVGLTIGRDSIGLYYNRNNGTQDSATITLGADIDGSDNTLHTNIRIPTGVSGWTNVVTGEQGGCEIGSEFQTTKFRVTFDYDPSTVDYGNLAFYYNINLSSGGYSLPVQDSINFNYETGIPYLVSSYFETAATLTWSASTKELIVEYPSSMYIEDLGGTFNVMMTNFGTYYCHIGSNDLIQKIEKYEEIKQPLIPYVQETRAALSGKQDTLSAGTGIDITNDVISVTGVVETSAITTAITSSSTDAQVPSAKAVYDIVGDIETLLSQI